MRITAPRTQDKRLVPLLDTPPKWLPGIDVGIQINFHLNFFFLFNWNILLLLFILFLFLSFPSKGLVSAALRFQAGFLLFFFFVGNGVVRMLGWSGSFLMPLTPTIGCCDKIGSLRFVPFKPSVPHYQGQNRAIPAPHYL